MTPVTQTEFYDPAAPPEKQRGNCLTAVVASLMDLPIDQVPNFVQDHVDHAAADDEDDAGDWHWWTRLHRFVADRGWQFRNLHPVETPEREEPGFGFPAPEPGEFYAVSGISPRDARIHHIVIYRDGEMVHDPHPDGTGLTLVDDEYHWSLVRVDGADDAR